MNCIFELLQNLLSFDPEKRLNFQEIDPIFEK